MAIHLLLMFWLSMKLRTIISLLIFLFCEWSTNYKIKKYVFLRIMSVFIYKGNAALTIIISYYAHV